MDGGVLADNKKKAEVLAMPVYRVFVDDKDTGDYVAASSPQDAYADVATSLPLTYKNVVRLEEVEEACP